MSSTPRTWFVSRHPGAVAWARGRRLPIDCWVEHLEPAEVAAGDTVIGTLPVPQAAGVCARGGRYLHLTLNLPRELRGRELSADDLCLLGAELNEFRVALVGDRF